MNRFVNVLIGICLLSTAMPAQRGGMAGGRPGTASPAHGMRPGRPAGPGHGSGAWGGGKLWHWDRFHDGWNQPVFGASNPGFSGTYEPDPSPTQSNGGLVILMMPPAAQPAPEPPPPPAPIRSQLREYSWPPSSGDSASAFAIVLKDGTVRRASTLCWQDSVLTYVAPDGVSDAVDASAIDRETTRRANSRDLLQ
jgi:hypothetical protein